MRTQDDSPMTEIPITDEMIGGFRVEPGVNVRLDRWATKWTIPAGLEELNKDQLKREANEFVTRQVRDLAELQDEFWADGRYSLLLIFQGLDSSGKDSTIKHVTSGMNPAGISVISFKEPTRDELRHNYFWRYVRALPAQGHIGVYNRSYYEETTVVRVNPGLLLARSMPDRAIDDDFWRERFEDINALERQITRSGTVVLKFFLTSRRTNRRNACSSGWKTRESNGSSPLTISPIARDGTSTSAHTRPCSPTRPLLTPHGGSCRPIVSGQCEPSSRTSSG